MFDNIYKKAYTLFSKIKEKIVFLPTIISIGAFCLGLLLITFRDTEIENFFTKTPLVKIHELDTLREILSTFLMSLISITIFSFSMVMLVLNQAASHYSPKLLNWLVGQKKYQFILGMYLGTIVFTILLLIQIPEDTDFKPLFHFAVVLNAALTFYCITLFVKFISNVSDDIQVSNIVENIYKKTRKRIDEESGNSDDFMAFDIDAENWFEFSCNDSGYLQKVTYEGLTDTLRKHNLKMIILQKFGQFYITKNPLYKLNKYVTDKSIIDSINANFVFYPGENIRELSMYGFRQLSDIAVKAMSTGINDPGTANICIDHLFDLLSYKMGKKDLNVILDNNGTPRILLNTYSVSEIIRICFTPVLNYTSNDISILKNFILSLNKLSYVDQYKVYYNDLNQLFAEVLLNIEHQKDKPYFYTYLQNSLKELKESEGNYFNIK
ncbi:MAG: DUF2254 domain-containing protein [Cytophagaceae bacterium]